MKPFYRVELGDAFDMAPTFVDHVITDPPYDAHCHANQSSGTAMARHVADGRGGGIPRVVPKFDSIPEDFAWLDNLSRSAKRWTLAFCTVESFGPIRQLVGRRYVRGAIWYKPNSMGQLTGDRPATAFEGIAILHDGSKKRWNGRGSFGIWKCNGTRGKKGRHPNEKPLDLCRKLVALFTDRGDTILDPFCGSAAIGQAAIELGRSYIGIDKDAEWVEKARLRLSGCRADRYTDDEALVLCRMK
jgi:site-specific DNA-methyltransferase (adenine-specific)